MSKDKYETMKLSTTERNIDQAIQRVYETYGPDLSAFFKDVQQRKAQAEAPRKSTESQISDSKKAQQ